MPIEDKIINTLKRDSIVNEYDDSMLRCSITDSRRLLSAILVTAVAVYILNEASAKIPALPLRK